ncbi:helix-turn-helix transcriptional regulator [Monashia sp. NPDC004114]
MTGMTTGASKSDVGLRGRTREQGALDQLRARVRSGLSATVVLRGEAGIGKTALLRYIADRAATDFRVAEIAGVESEIELPYAGLHQLCHGMVDQLESLPAPQQAALSVALGLADGRAPDRFLIGLATLSLLAQVAETRPLMCVVDDAQWLDDASAQVLSFVARRLAVESVAMVFATRDRRGRPPLAGLPELQIGGLSQRDARALLAGVVPGRLDERVRDRIVAETGGNPLALLELPRGMTSAELAGGFGLPNIAEIPAHLEDHYSRRMQRLPAPTQQLMLLAAADAIGEPLTVWRAAEALGITMEAASAAAREELLEIGTRVRFHHPLVRSAVYRSASAAERRAAHRALATATERDPDAARCAWHRAHAAAGPDEAIASELERCASRADARGGSAAAAALIDRSANLTPDPVTRVERRLAAAQFNLEAGAFDAALGLLAEAEAEVSNEFAHARVELLRGLVASASNAGSDAPLLLLAAARRLEPLDIQVARQTLLDAWGAALFAGHLASPGGDLMEVSRVAKATPLTQDPVGPFDRMLDGLATLITDSRAAAAPILRQAVDTLLADDVAATDWLHWGVLASSAAVTLWDFECWNATSDRQIELARKVGALSMLSVALNGQAMIAAWRGDLDAATAFVAEDDAIKQATGAQIAPYGAMLLAAYQGRVADASALIASTIEDSTRRGEGLGVDLARWTGAILNNSVGRYEEALAMASPANANLPGIYISTWMLPERIESGVRCGQLEAAAAALHEFRESANPGESEWGLGVEARSRAMLAEGEAAEALYREAIDHLARTPIRTELARAHLVFGEWLRRENRRVDAREQLRTAHLMFSLMSADGFAERARRELAATGEHVRKRRDRPAALTSQEEHIARLARDGRANPEIAAELFISTRTVEWHLGKVFTKLGITSRNNLRDAMPAPGRAADTDTDTDTAT